MTERVERRLAAILAADVVGYSRLMGADEEGTLAQLKACRKTLVDPKIAEHRGRIVKTTGDGMLVEFASAVDAARCAVEIQRGMNEQNTDLPQAKRLEFRIGVHVGDIIIDENDIFGDGVNIAARLEGIAEAGGIWISDDAHRQIRGKVDIAYDDMGPQALKNIAEPMRAWRCRIDVTQSSPLPAKSPIEIVQPLALPDRPSIAVLPFQNMSGDPEQEYFADGMVEDIITALSRFKSLFVIARNSSFTYKGKAVDIKQVGRELGVRYVLEGSVRKAGGRVRITGQLIDSTNGGHLWADKFDGSLDDVFVLQDKITEQVVGVIAPRVERAEVARLRLARTDNLSAYDLCLRAFENMRLFSAEGLTTAIELCRQAIALDPTFSTAYGVATRCFVFRRAFSLMQDEAAEVAEGTAFAKQAVATGQDDAYALSAAAQFYGSVLFEMELAESLVDQAITVNPNLVETWRNRGFISTYVGKHEAAISQLETALRLSPIDPDIHSTYLVMSTAHLYLRKFDDALVWSAKALARRPQMVVARRSAIAANVALGNLDEARRMMAEAQKLEPQMTISRLQQVMPYRRPEDRAFMVECMRQAGMPE